MRRAAPRKEASARPHEDVLGMRSVTRTTVITYCLLALAGGFPFMLPDRIEFAVEQPKPVYDAVNLTGLRPQDLPQQQSPPVAAASLPRSQ